MSTNISQKSLAWLHIEMYKVGFIYTKCIRWDVVERLFMNI